MSWTRDEMDELAFAAMDVVRERGDEIRDFGHMLSTAHDFGAAAFAGLIGMAEAIRNRYRYKVRRPISLEPDIPAVTCSSCGAPPGVYCFDTCEANIGPEPFV